MNIANLIPNSSIKNYKELCTLLEIPPTGGNYKESILNELKRYVDYSSEGRKFTINKIYEIPLMKPPREGSLWITTTIKNLFDCLKVHAPDNEDVTEIFIERYKLCLYIGLCNEDFYFNRTDYLNSNDKDTVRNFFYSLSSDKISKALTSVLSYMERNYAQTVVRTAYSYKIVGYAEVIIASEHMSTKITDILGQEARKIGCKQIQQAFHSGRKEEFIKNIKHRLNVELGIYGLKQGVKFLFTKVIKERAEEVDRDLAYLEKFQTNEIMLHELRKQGRKFCESLCFLDLKRFNPIKLISKEDQLNQHYRYFEELLQESIKLVEEQIEIGE